MLQYQCLFLVLFGVSQAVPKYALAHSGYGAGYAKGYYVSMVQLIYILVNTKNNNKLNVKCMHDNKKIL